MTAPIQFSIILPLFNKEETIKQTIETVLNQTYKDFELIIVNDGSTDNSAKIAAEFKSGKVHLINQINKGVSAARNTGINAAKNDYMGFIDGDDFWEENYLEEMAKFIQDFPMADVFGAGYDRIENGIAFKMDFGLPDGFRGLVENYFGRKNGGWLFWPTSTIIKKEAIKVTGLFDEKINQGEDTDLWFRLAYQHKVAFYSRIFGHYNLDGPNRAMNIKHDFSKTFYCYTGKFKKWEKKNIIFNRFINFVRISGLKKIYSDLNTLRKERKDYLSIIDTREQGAKFKVFFSLPFFLKDWFLKMKYNS